MDALVVSSTTETAIDRPRPKALPLASPASAFVVETELGLALIATSPDPPESVTVAPLPSDAVLEASTRLKESEPATLFLPPPAPLVASAPNVFVESLPTVCVRDSMVRAPALTTSSAPIDASIVSKARFTATAAPTLVALVPAVEATALPSAFAVESVLP